MSQVGWLRCNATLASTCIWNVSLRPLRPKRQMLRKLRTQLIIFADALDSVLGASEEESGVVLGSSNIRLQEELGGVQVSGERSLPEDCFNSTLVFGTGLRSVVVESEKAIRVIRLKTIPN